MAKEEKIPWKKNIDSRYISGEDLKLGIELGKGLAPEMVVTMASFKDVESFDQNAREKVNKTGVFLKTYPEGKMLYKPLILNNTNGQFLSKEIGKGSDFITDFDTEKPFVLYAKPDKRFGHVARCRKYFAPVKFDFKPCIEAMGKMTDIDEFAKYWGSLSDELKAIPEVVAKKEEIKKMLS